MVTVEDRLTAEPSDKAPYLAACLILIDRDDAAQPRVLLGKRHGNLTFLPGKFVFPGGRTEPEDARMHARGTLPPQAMRLCHPAVGTPVANPPSLAMTAIRELFEETGLMIGDRISPPIAAPRSASWTHFTAAGVTPNLTKLHYVARALTPPELPRRFDTHFFAADAADIGETVAGFVHDGAELVELRWVTLGEVAVLDILPITQFVTTELARRLAEGLGHDLPVPFFYMQDHRWIRAEF